jgi:hypothetical protein
MLPTMPVTTTDDLAKGAIIGSSGKLGRLIESYARIAGPPDNVKLATNTRA